MKSYRYFLITLVVLIFLPYSIKFQESFATTGLGIAGLFYYLNIGNGQIGFQIFAYNTLPQILNIVVITGCCLYFTFYRKRAERTGTDYSLKIAGVYFALVIITLLIVDWNGMMGGFYIGSDGSHLLSTFGLLLAYLTIVIPAFQKLSKEKSISKIATTTNRYLLYIYRNTGIIFGFVILLSPNFLQIIIIAVDVNFYNVAVTLIGVNYVLDFIPYFVNTFSDSSLSFFVGLSPQLVTFAIFWAPQIILAVQVLRYLGGQTSKRLLIIGFLISIPSWLIFLPGIIYSLLYFGGFGAILVPVPILQLLSILILRIERSETISEELEIEPREDDMVKVPIRYVLLSRIRKRRNSDW